ncbi:hypothetical protein COP1_030007 [Malus domestica]|uniref:Pentatricopeptide repeat-containing protein n=1 Tax=Malus domestica TaxID=3750 RepID=A0A498KEH4_MALDO|nr:hypothetical protein DVH24_039068 [Malus domestica]
MYIGGGKFVQRRCDYLDINDFRLQHMYSITFRRKHWVYLEKLLNLGIRPDAAAVVSILSAIADFGFVEEGKWVHTYISTNKIKLGSGFIASALIDMYAKCGHIENAYHVFKHLSHYKNTGD